MGNYRNLTEYKQRVSHFKQLILNGRYIDDAAKEAGISLSAANVLDRKEGLNSNRRPLGNCNHNYFDTIDTEEKAYILGFFLADGTIDKDSNRMGINNAVDDIEVIEIINKAICPNMLLKIKDNTGKKSTCILRWSSKIMKLRLEDFGIKPNKTYDFDFEFPFELIPDNLLRHFIRGFFDGDGCLTFGRLEFISTSKPFAKQICNIFENMFNVEGRIRERKTKNVIEYMFYFKTKDFNRKRFLSEVSSWFYKDSSIYLSRKKKKFDEFLNTEVSSKITKGLETP